MRNIKLSALIIIGAALAACASKVPARIDTVNGHTVEVATAGSGSGPTVVFEAGLGMDWTVWDDVASQIAQHTRVFTYSRPGYGASGPVTTPRDPQTIVEELRALLAYEGYSPPYILVGHSMGGGYMELFAKAHPDEVAGVVLVDPRHRDFLAACEAAGLEMCGIDDASLAQQAPAVIAEYRAYATASDEMRAAGSFGAYPVRVLTATDHAGWSPAHEALWASMLASLAAEATDGKQILVHGSGHVIQVDRPDAVVDAIVALLPAS